MMRPPSPKPSPAPSPTGGPATMPPTAEEEEEEDDPVEDGATATAAPSYQPPTPAPTADIEDTDPCGDGTCDADEDSSTCPPDCAGVVLSSATYTTTTDGEDGDGDDDGATTTLISARGVQFFVVAGDRDVLIRNVETFVDVGDGVSMYDTQIEVFAKLGTYAGYEMDSDAWVRVYNGHVEVGDDGPPPTSSSSSSSINETTTATTRSSPTTLPLNGGEGVPIPAGSMVSFYVYADAGLACTPGRRAGYVVADDGVLRVHEGVELEGRWSGYDEDSPPVAFWGSFG